MAKILSKVRLTKGNVEKILRENDGLVRDTSYESRNYREDRRYKINDGKVYVESHSKSSWADSREERNYILDQEETRRFLYNNDLNYLEDELDD